MKDKHVLYIAAYKRGLEDGKAAAVYEPPTNPGAQKLYEIGYVRGFEKLMELQRQFTEVD